MEVKLNAYHLLSSVVHDCAFRFLRVPGGQNIYEADISGSQDTTNAILGYSMGTLHLYERFVQSTGGNAPSENLGILQPLKSVLRPV